MNAIDNYRCGEAQSPEEDKAHIRVDGVFSVYNDGHIIPIDIPDPVSTPPYCTPTPDRSQSLLRSFPACEIPM